MEYLNENELRDEIIKIQKSQIMKTLRAEFNSYIESPANYVEYKDNLDKINAIVALGFVEKHSRERYGEMILQLVEKICTKSNFAGYTYKDDFYSNAIQRVLSYSINNFNPDMISKRSGERVKAFAYLTSIINNAIVEIINERKAEHNDLMEKFVPLDDLYYEVNRNYRPQLRRADVPKDVPSVILKVVSDEMGEYILDGNSINIGTFIGVYETIKEYTKETKIQFEYPSHYVLSLEEADKIMDIGFEYLNLYRFEKERYKPSFPKKEVNPKINMFEDWEV